VFLCYSGTGFTCIHLIQIQSSWRWKTYSCATSEQTHDAKTIKNIINTWQLALKCVDCNVSCRFSKFICCFRVQYYEPGSEHQVIVPGDPVGKLMSVILQLEYQTNPLNPLTWRFFLRPHIYIGWMQIESIEERHRYILALCLVKFWNNTKTYQWGIFIFLLIGLAIPELYSCITLLTGYQYICISVYLYKTGLRNEPLKQLQT
jgi:hypothetical protein